MMPAPTTNLAILVSDEEVDGDYRFPDPGFSTFATTTPSKVRDNTIRKRLRDLMSGPLPFHGQLIVAARADQQTAVTQLIGENAHFGLPKSNVTVVAEQWVPPLRINSVFGTIEPDTESPKPSYNAGLAKVLEGLCESKYLGRLHASGISWLFITTFRNVGAGIDRDILRATAVTTADAVAEVVPLQSHATLVNVVLEPPFSPYRHSIICHKARLQTERSARWLSNARYGAVGNYWVRITSLLRRYGATSEQIARKEIKWEPERYKLESLMRMDADRNIAVQWPAMEVFYGQRVIPWLISAACLPQPAVDDTEGRL